MPKETGGGDRRGTSAFYSVSAHALFWSVGVGALAADLWSKHWAFSALGPREVRPMISGALDLHRSLNDGAVFGSMPGYSGLFIIASVAALGVVLYMFSQSTRTQRSLHVALALILAGAMGNLYDRAYVIAEVVKYTDSAGRTVTIIGTNLNEPGDAEIRLTDWPAGTRVSVFQRSEVMTVRQGVVRDFIKFVWKFPAWVPRVGGRDVWPWVFNVADAALVVGVGILLLHVLFDRKRQSVRGESA